MKKTIFYRLASPGSAGQEIVEYALVLPILLALMLGIMELGMAVFNYNTMSNAAREAARTGIVTRDEPTILTSGLRLTSATPLTTTNFTIRWLNDSNVVVASNLATKITVTVSRSYRLISGGFLTLFGLKSTIPMTATSTMHLE
jgi:Flp pilus assembly protein TadG